MKSKVEKILLQKLIYKSVELLLKTVPFSLIKIYTKLFLHLLSSKSHRSRNIITKQQGYKTAIGIFTFL